MMSSRRLRALIPLLYLLVVTACGGGGGSGSGSQPVVTPPPPPPPPPPPTSVVLSSDAGDYIGAGQNYSYSNADARISVTAANAHLTIIIDGDESWRGEFVLPDTYTQFEVGTYTNLARYPFHVPAEGGLSWTGEGRGCNTLVGTITINEVTYDGTSLVGIDFEFEQYCEGGTTALRGDIYWDANDATSPPGPAASPPAGLWEPAAGAVPATGNYVYLESEPGDYIGAGMDYLYTNATAVISINSGNASLSVSIDGDERWNGDFKAMDVLSFLEAGYYGDLSRYPFHNPVKGGLSWSGEGRGCNRLTGWFVVDSVTYDGNTLTSIELRFEQHCEGGGPALNGAIRWDVNDNTGAPGPVVPPPSGLWEPAQGTTPASGNYVYLESDFGDYIGGGQNYLYTPADSVISTSSQSAHLSVSIDGDENWRGEFEGMNSLMRLEVGYYGNLQRFPFHNPVTGGLSWSGEGRGCNTLTGWFVVDSVTYDGNTLMAIDLRFEQHCEGGGPALNGEIHWDANDTTMAPGPVLPVPSGLWTPTPGSTPTSGNYVYLESRAGDWVGNGGTYLYTLLDSIISVDTSGARVNVAVNGDENWGGNFQAMNSLTVLEVGYYGDLQRYPFHNPVRGGLSWSGEGRGCNTLTGWFVIDSITYDGNTLTAIDLRFQQHCDGGPALNGEIHWDASDTTQAPGPVLPIPDGLWTPTPGITPATGNYVYLESEFGDYVGAGANYLYTPAEAIISASASGAGLHVDVNGDEDWRGDFQPMSSVARLEVGYYGNLQRFPFHNPVKGGLSWSGEGRGCNQLTGWFVVDSVTYDGNTLTAIDLRFEQHCEGGVPALNGEIHWDASDTTEAPGPVLPIPAGLWTPPPGITPATGNYVYLESDIGDYIGQGANYLYTDADTQFTVNAPGARLEIGVNGAESWTGMFQGMNSLNYLEAGYYGDLQRYPFHNAVKGGLTWYGEGRGCNRLSGWFAIDSVTYVGVTLTSIDLRFEQRCDGGPPLHGAIHWSQ